MSLTWEAQVKGEGEVYPLLGESTVIRHINTRFYALEALQKSSVNSLIPDDF
jgi:hypothetical protein